MHEGLRMSRRKCVCRLLEGVQARNKPRLQAVKGAFCGSFGADYKPVPQSIEARK